MVATMMRTDTSQLVFKLGNNPFAIRLTASDLTGVLMVTTAAENRMR